MYTQKSVTETDNAEGPDVRHSSHPSMTKKKKKSLAHPITTCAWGRRLCADRSHKTASRVSCPEAASPRRREEGRAGPAPLAPPCLTWGAISSLEPWAPLLSWGWPTQPRRVRSADPFKGLLSPRFWLGPESRVASGLEGSEGKAQLVPTSPGAAGPSCSRLPGGAAS